MNSEENKPNEMKKGNYTKFVAMLAAFAWQDRQVLNLQYQMTHRQWYCE